jgi:hypothetical protein
LTISEPQPLDLIAAVFDKLHAAYGSRFTDMWLGIDAGKVKSTWAEQLAGLTHEEIWQGFDRLPAKWPPDAPEFRDLCRSEADYERMYRHAVDQRIRRKRGADRWHNGAVYRAATLIGADFDTQPYATLKNRWKAALDASMSLLQAGRIPDLVPPARIELPDIGKSITSAEAAKPHLAAAKLLLQRRKD